MEKKQVLPLTLAVALLAGLLGGCGEKTPPEETAPLGSEIPTASEAPVVSQAPTETVEPLSLSDQVNLIASQVDLWRLEEEEWADGCWYAYTISDLDLNGRLELLSTVTQGTGMFTTSRLWEVNEAGDGLYPADHEACPLVLEVMGTPEGGILPYPAYYDRDTDTMWVELHDLVRNGIAGNYECKRAVSLKDGTLDGRYLAYRFTEYDQEGGETVRYEGPAEGEIITQEEYENAGTLAFPGAERQGIRMEWLVKPDTRAMSREALTDALLICAEGYTFGLELPQ